MRVLRNYCIEYRPSIQLKGMATCTCCCCCPCGKRGSLTKTDLSSVPGVDSSKYTFALLSESSKDDAIKVGARGFNGIDGSVDGEQSQSWVLGSDPNLPNATTRMEHHTFMQKFLYHQAQGFGGLHIGVRNAEQKLVGTAVLFPP